MASRRKLRIVMAMHEDLVPPESIDGLDPKDVHLFQTEYDVRQGLRSLGHEVYELGIHDELAPIRRMIKEVKPHIVFNLLEAFHGESVYDQHFVAYLELLRQAYTGCNPRGLTLGRDKALSKKILHYHRILVPHFAVFLRGRAFRMRRRLEYPLIVKSLVEEGSYGISEASVVHNEAKLRERIAFIHDKIGTDAIVEQFVPGRELYVSIYGNQQLTVLPTWELTIDNLRADAPLIATRSVKWDLDFQDRRGVFVQRAEGLSEELEAHITRTSKRIYRVLGLSGYARIDFRLDATGRLFFLEANPNPDIKDDEEFASAALEAGMPYPAVLQKIVSLGMRGHRRG
jgi:D-alanine-D-alanine ligase